MKEVTSLIEILIIGAYAIMLIMCAVVITAIVLYVLKRIKGDG